VVVVVVIEQIDSAPFYLSLFTGYLSIQTTWQLASSRTSNPDFFFLEILGFELKPLHLSSRYTNTWAMPPAPELTTQKGEVSRTPSLRCHITLLWLRFICSKQAIKSSPHFREKELDATVWRGGLLLWIEWMTLLPQFMCWILITTVAVFGDGASKKV
jgi:hypothetical protein